MTESEGLVRRLDGDFIWVDFRSECSTCTTSQGCGLGSGRGKPSHRVRNTVGARVGDTVIMSVPDGAVWRAAFRCYVLPLLIVLVVAALGRALGGEGGSVAGVVIGLAVGWLALRRGDQRQTVPDIRLKTDFVCIRRENQST